VLTLPYDDCVAGIGIDTGAVIGATGLICGRVLTLPYDDCGVLFEPAKIDIGGVFGCGTAMQVLRLFSHIVPGAQVLTNAKPSRPHEKYLAESNGYEA